jgi:methyltransferase NSUN6
MQSEVLSSLSVLYSHEELQALDAALRQPCPKLYVRANLLKATREELRSELIATLNLDIEPHPVLDDVLVVRRSPPSEELCRFEQVRSHGSTRFEARRTAGLPAHEVVVDRFCGEAVLKGADIFARGVRGASLALKEGQPVAIYCDVDGGLLRGAVPASTEGLELLGLGQSCLERSAIFRDEQGIPAQGLAVRVVHTVAGDLPSMNGVLPGMLYVQSLPSLVVAHVLAAQPGDSVLDLCGAPGRRDVSEM